MKLLLLTAFIWGTAMANNSVHDFTINLIGKGETPLNTYKGSPILFVNIATQCGYTPQLSVIEKIYQEYSAKGLIVIGIPSNDFGGQTPEGDEEVVKFCKRNHGVSFPLTTKTIVKGSSKSALIDFLTKGKDIAWNFEKFLIDKNGQIAARYLSSVSPDSKEIQQEVEKLLNKN